MITNNDKSNKILNKELSALFSDSENSSLESNKNDLDHNEPCIRETMESGYDNILYNGETDRS